VSLQKCPDCGTDVSTAAAACPKCGRPFKAKQSAKSSIGCGSVLLLFAAVGILAAMCSRNPDQSTVQNQQGNPSPPTVPAPSPRHVSPSFDCTKARSRSERLICADPELSALDADFAVLYKKAKSVASDKAAFIRANRSEWQRRENTCFDKACLVGWYAQKQLQLSELIANAAAPARDHPPGSSVQEPIPADREETLPVTPDPIAEQFRAEVARVAGKMGLDIGPVTGPAFGWLARPHTVQQEVNINAAIPTVMRCMEKAQNVPDRIGALHACEDAETAAGKPNPAEIGFIRAR
jgi:hypothetical protein